MNELLAIVVLACAALGLRIVVQGILRKAAFFPTDEDSRSRGFKDVVDRLRERAGRR